MTINNDNFGLSLISRLYYTHNSDYLNLLRANFVVIIEGSYLTQTLATPLVFSKRRLRRLLCTHSLKIIEISLLEIVFMGWMVKWFSNIMLQRRLRSTESGFSSDREPRKSSWLGLEFWKFKVCDQAQLKLTRGAYSRSRSQTLW